MTKKDQAAYKRALECAAHDGVCIVLDGGNHWQVRGSDGMTHYTVQATEDRLSCTCLSRHYCKHQAVCQQRLNEQQASREKHAAAANTALMLTEHSEREMTGQVYSQEERLRALAYLPVVIASYAVVMGPAHARQWYQDKEAQWDRYQMARINGCLGW